jgi:MFS family permease
MKQYKEIWSNRIARNLLLAAFPARLAYSMIGLAIFFKAEQTTKSIPIAGLALGLNSLAGSFTAGIRGAAIDKWGHKWPIRILVPGYAIGIIFENMASTSTEILVWAFLLGISAPPINISIRPLWKQIFSEELVRGAYGVDTALMNSVGVIGPAMATTLSLSSHPGSALSLCAGSMLIGGFALERIITSRPWEHEKKNPNEAKFLKVPAIQLLAIEGVFIGLGWGFFDVGVPAFTTLEGVPHRTAWLFAIMSISNVAGGLIAGLLKKRTSSYRTMRAIYGAWALFSLPLYFTNPDWSLALVGATLGLAGGALQVIYFEVLELVRPAGTATASLGWLWTIEGSMAAAGSAMGGWVAKNVSPQFCLGITSVMLCIGFMIMTLGRNRLAAADIAPTEKARTEAIGDTENLTE